MRLSKAHSQPILRAPPRADGLLPEPFGRDLNMIGLGVSGAAFTGLGIGGSLANTKLLHQVKRCYRGSPLPRRFRCVGENSGSLPGLSR